MFIQYLRHTCLLFVLLAFNNASFADIYKWVDDEGNTHYSQQAPRDQQADLIKAPPPARSANDAQKEIDTLIEKQSGTFETKEEERRLAREVAEDDKKREEYCLRNKHNLQQYQDNPGRRMIDSDGNIIAPDEEQRIQKIAEIQARLAKHCQ
ncbi:MAG: DUF4124 domain-containing protein [Gammaproteobacteria bacterium]|nr:DUF4124 domain-containing protein [Gammaproteobacteria bacterium]